MNRRTQSNDPGLDRDEQAFVRRVAELYTAPETSASRRVAFNARLEERLARRQRWSWRPALASAVAAVALAVLAVGRLGGPAVSPGTGAAGRPPAVAADAETPERALLALAAEGAPDQEEELPEDYLAIESLFLGG